MTQMFSKLYKSMTLYQKRNLNVNVEQMKSKKKVFNNKMEVLFDYRTNKPNLGRTRSSSRKANQGMYTAGETIRAKETNSVELGPWLDDFDNKKKIYNSWIVEKDISVENWSNIDGSSIRDWSGANIDLLCDDT